MTERGRSHSLALLQHGSTLDIDIKQVNLLVSVGNLAMLVDPQDGILDPVGVKAGLVDANMDGQLLAAGFFAQTQDKVALEHRLDETDRFGA
jgi:hypothetical protein